MGNIFAITTTIEDIKADAAGKASAIFTVTNTTNKPLRGIAQAKALGNTHQEWLNVEGEIERDFGPAGTQQFTVDFKSTGAETGKFPFRLDVASAANPDEEFTEGPTVTVETAAPAPVVKKGLPWWIFAIIGGLLLIILLVVVYLLMRGGKAEPQPGTPTPVAATPTPTPTPRPATPTPRPATPTPTVSTAKGIGTDWQVIDGGLKQISVGGASHIWGVNSGDAIFRWNGSGWQGIDGRLKNVSVGADGTVWGVNAGDAIFRWNGSGWQRIDGGLKQISVGSANSVWGVNAGDADL